jgi:hypothetical protein
LDFLIHEGAFVMINAKEIYLKKKTIQAYAQYRHGNYPPPPRNSAIIHTVTSVPSVTDRYLFFFFFPYLPKGFTLSVIPSSSMAYASAKVSCIRIDPGLPVLQASFKPVNNNGGNSCDKK